MSNVEQPDLDFKQRALDAFLVDNQELESLNARLSSFNLFQVLRVDRAEIRHSNVLAWLLTPHESHGLGPVFLRRFLSRLLLENDSSDVSMTPSRVELMSFADIEVLREWKNIDVLVRSAEGKWCLLIENKIHSKEGRGQLKRYFQLVQEEMPGYEIIPVFLTLEGDDPSDEEAGYIPHSHSKVLELAEQIIEQHRGRVPEDAQVFLSHYLDTLRRLTMQDEELIELCRAIYRKHRQAINLITEYGSASEFQEACINEIQSLFEAEEHFVLEHGANSVWFLPKAVSSLLPSNIEQVGWKFLPVYSPIMFWVTWNKNKTKLRMVLEVGQISDSELRKSVLRAIREAGIRVRDVGFRDDAKYTRLLSHTMKPRNNEEGDPDLSEDEFRRMTAALWKKFEDPLAKVVEALREFDWQQA